MRVGCQCAFANIITSTGTQVAARERMSVTDQAVCEHPKAECIAGDPIPVFGGSAPPVERMQCPECGKTWRL